MPLYIGSVFGILQERPINIKKTIRRMAEYKEYNDPVLAFWNGFRGQFKWDLLPFRFLYELYRAWHERYNPGGTGLSDR